MQSRRIAHCVCLLAVMGATRAQVPNLFTFGDSLTDRGDGAFRLTDGTYPPPSAYWQGRFTNSPGTWADYVAAKKLSTNTDFAIGASTACTYANATGHQLEFPSMVKQVDAWLADPKRPKGKKVVTIWAGHNDIMSGAELPKSQIAGIPKQVLACLLSAAGKILAADKDATVLLGSLAPIDKTPLFGKIPQVAKLINTMNKILKTGVVGLKLKHGLNRVAYWDINKIMSDAIAKPSALGFTHGPPQSCVVFKSSFQNFFTNFTMVPSTPCATPNDYLFYDGVHPTSKSHSFIAASYFAKLVELKIIKSVPA